MCNQIVQLGLCVVEALFHASQTQANSSHCSHDILPDDKGREGRVRGERRVLQPLTLI